MKSLIYPILTSIIIFFTQCSDDPIKADKRFEADIKTTPTASGRICAHIPTEMTISLLTSKGETENYQFSYLFSEGEGDLYINGEKLPEKETLPLKKTEFKAYYIPGNIGVHRLKLIFSNNDFTTETIYSINADSYSMNITEANAEDMFPERKANLYFLFAAENDTCNNFKASASVTQGKGELFAIESAACNGMPDSSFITTRNDNFYNIRKGINRIQYIPADTGAHTLLLSVSNAYGHTRDFELFFEVEYPEHVLKTSVADSCINIFSQAAFSVSISGQETSYPASFRFLKNSGKVAINGNATETERKFSLPNGTSKGYITADNPGETIVEFTATDKYGRIQKDSVRFTVIPSYAEITVTGFDSLPLAGKEYPFQIRVNSGDAYTGEYKLHTESPHAEIRINGNSTGGNNETAFSKTINASYIPQRPGKSALVIKVTDSKNQTTLRELPYTAAQIHREITVKDYNPLIKYKQKTRIEFDIRSNTGESYSCKILTKKDAGEIKLNGKDYTGACPANTSNYLEFIPSATGEVVITLEITSSSGAVMTKDLVFSVSTTKMDISVSDFQNGNPNIKTSVPIYARFKVSSPSASSMLQCRFSGNPAGNTLYKIDGENYSEGEERNIPSDREIPVSLSFLHPGKQEVSLSIRDGEGNSENIKFEYTVTESPITLNIKEFFPTTLPGVENTAYLSVDKKDYNGTFFCQAYTEGMAEGEFRINGEECRNGNKIPVTDKENIKISFLPQKPGKAEATITISDENGNRITEKLSYDIRNPELELSVNPPSKIIAGQETAISFSVTKAHYSGKYHAEISGADLPIQLNGKEYTGGKTEINGGSNELKITAHTNGNIHIKVHDEWGGNAEKDISITPSIPAMELNVYNPAADISGSTNFIVTASHESGKDMLLSLSTTPADAGKFYINSEEYGGERNITPGKAVNVVFKPLTTGKITVTVGIRDKISGVSKEKQIRFNSLNTIKYPIILHAEKERGEIYVYSSGKSKLTLEEENYSSRDSFTYEISELSGKFTLTNEQKIPYTSGEKHKVPASSPELTFLTSPQNTEDVIFDVIIIDKYGQSAIQRFHYTVVNRDAEILFNNFNETTFTNKEEQFNIQITKDFFPSALEVNISANGNISDFRINGSQTPSPARINCKSGTTIPVSYIPDSKGSVEFTVSVTDEFGFTNTRSISTDVHSNNVEILTIPVEYTLNRAPSLVNDSSHFESYIGDIHFLGHDGEGRINDYETVFSNTEHITVSGGNPNGSIALGNATFPVYVYEGTTPVDEQKQEHIFLRAHNVSPIYLKYSRTEGIKINWGYKFIHTVTNTTVLDVKSSSQCYLRNCSYPYPGTEEPTFYQFHPIDDNPYSCKPLANDIRNCRLAVYCDIEPSPYKINTDAREYHAEENKTATFKFSYSSDGGDIKRAKVGIYKSPASSGEISDIKVNGIPLSEGVYLAPDEEATVTFIPQGTFHLSISLTEGKNSIISDNILFISQ